MYLLLKVVDEDGREWYLGAVSDGQMYSTGCGTTDRSALKGGDFKVNEIRVVEDAPEFN